MKYEPVLRKPTKEEESLFTPEFLESLFDTEKKISEIREALEKATQGQWKWIDSGGLERKKLVGEWEIMNFGIGGVYDQVAGSEPDEDDAHLIANAPDWLRFLLNELELVNRERDKLIEGLRKLAKTNAENISEIRKWKAKQNDTEVTDLDWYNYVARNILKEIGVTVE